MDILESKRNFGLDFIRSVAILLVLASHLGISENHTFGLKLGGLGVEIFFVLSGFLIGQILIRNFTQALTLQSVFNFWIRRWYRTLPLYYLIILLKFIFIDHSLGYKILVYFFFLQNNFVGIDFMPITWSLVIEEWFYLSLPLMLFVFFYRWELRPERLLLFIILFIVVINVARFVFVFYMNRGYGAITGNFPFRLDSMMCGVLLANIKFNYKTFYQKLTSLKLFLVIFILYFFLLSWIGEINLKEGNLDKNIWAKTLWFFLNSICIAFLIPFIEEKIVINSRTNIFRIAISSISIFSYSIYLIHIEIFKRILKSEPLSYYWLVETFLALALTFIISAFIYGLYEKPMTNLRDSFNSNLIKN
jgi:peptidoglycan/LPS O-acetylase OafA/YrhL